MGDELKQHLLTKLAFILVLEESNWLCRWKGEGDE